MRGQEPVIWLITETANHMGGFDRFNIGKGQGLTVAGRDRRGRVDTRVPNVVENMAVLVEELAESLDVVCPDADAVTLVGQHTSPGRGVAPLTHAGLVQFGRADQPDQRR